MHFSRRGWLGLASAGWFAAAQRLRAAKDPTDENFWRLLKTQFPLEEGLLYLNAANIAPAPRAVLDRQQHYWRDFEANPSFQNREKFEPLRERARAKTARLLNCTADEIALLRNTSEGSNLIVNGLELQPGDEIIIGEHNHPCNNEAWTERAKRHGWVVRRLPVETPARSRQALAEQVAAALGQRTKVVALTHVTNVTGLRYPIEEIAALTRPRGMWLHVDGAQTFGAMRVDVRALGCDSYCGSAHKWLMGPLEAGVLYVRKERLAEVWPSIISAGWSARLAGARRLDITGQRDDARGPALEAALDFVQLVGVEVIEQRVRTLAAELKQRFAAIPDVRVMTNAEPELSGGIVKISTGEKQCDAHYERLWREQRLAISHTSSGPNHGLRFAPHIYNTREDLERAARAVRGLFA
jgi:selenocysteine lyase/cysteine desulfurase